MPITLNNLAPAKGSRKSKKRIGRGFTRGKTSGRGHKGQKSRSGVGGLKKLGMRRQLLATPKARGFVSQKEKASIVNLSSIDKVYKGSDEVTLLSLKEKKLVPRKALKVKILGVGEIKSPITVKGCTVSKSAAEKIQKAGGKVIA